MKMYQAMLKDTKDVNGRFKTMVTWIPTDKRLDIGTIITLKGDQAEWEITAIYDNNVQELDEVVSNRGFDNNNYDHHRGLGIH